MRRALARETRRTSYDTPGRASPRRAPRAVRPFSRFPVATNGVAGVARRWTRGLVQNGVASRSIQGARAVA